eukprot:11222385-Lingulodinium_polyedra.AAC.1
MFEQELQDYEEKSGEKLSLQLRVGMVLNGLDEDALRDYVLQNGRKYAKLDEFKTEIVARRRVARTARASRN